jgi:superfamily II DNA or RNA helicase
VTCRALDEGFNVPEARVAIIASSTASPRQRIQRLGRILRPARGKQRALVYTIYATDQEEQRLAREAETMDEIANLKWLKASSASVAE